MPTTTLKRAPSAPSAAVIERASVNQCDGAALDGATVVAGGRAVTTDGQGRFRVDGLDPGATQLIVTASGYLDARPQVVIIRGQTVDLDITLSPLPTTKPLASWGTPSQ